MSTIPNNRAHMVQLDEMQIKYLIEALKAHHGDLIPRECVPVGETAQDYEVAMLPYIEDMLADLIKIPANEYDRNMLHGFTL